MQVLNNAGMHFNPDVDVFQIVTAVSNYEMVKVW